jgi:predicted DNA-binding protein (UPF0251 family)
VLLCEPVVQFIPEPSAGAEPVPLFRDELEAIRLADVLGYYQDRAAEHMGISRATFARILERARRKVGEALVERRGLAIVVDAPIELYEKPRGCGCLRRRRAALAGPCPLHPEPPEEES